MQLLATLIGALILIQGTFGLINPSGFASVVGGMQMPPALYFATAVRIIVGLVLIFAASSSRAPWVQRAIGMLIAVGGAASPLIGDTFARPILRWWAEGGDTAVRLWAGFGATLGLFVFYTNLPLTRKPKDAAPPGSR